MYDLVRNGLVMHKINDHTFRCERCYIGRNTKSFAYWRDNVCTPRPVSSAIIKGRRVEAQASLAAHDHDDDAAFLRILVIILHSLPVSSFTFLSLLTPAP